MVSKFFVATAVKLNATSNPSPIEGSTGRGHGDVVLWSFLSTRGQVFYRGQNDSQKCTHCNQINHTIDRCWGCMANLPSLLELLICLILLDYLLYMTLILLVPSLRNLWFLKKIWVWFSNWKDAFSLYFKHCYISTSWYFLFSEFITFILDYWF